VTLPSKILCIGLNYADHARESGMTPPDAPLLFAKYPNTLIGQDVPLRYDPATTAQLDYEAELAVVIGRRARNVGTDEALQHVFGYTCANDVSARDVQLGDGQWVRGKSFDGFCPLGPTVVTADELPDPQGLGISLRVNGEVLQDSTTKEMIFSVAEIISHLSTTMTLEPGDVILTGTPYGVGMGRTPQRWLADGDVVEVTIDGIGTLRTPIAATAAGKD
jgi:2-keto-4-pentenoate hydratase/2-oxohepta-3-ene-1,7-dioic acid hydratase in catechol pathway